MKRGIVISGGASKGAWGGGVIQALYNKYHYDWKVLVGTSTGNLLMPYTALSKFDELKEIYTNVTNDDIFSVNPFTANGKINILNAIWRVIRNKKSLGEGGNLRKLIGKMFSVEEYYKIQQMNKGLFSCVSNFTTNEVEFKNNFTENHQNFLDFMYASASVPIAFDFVYKNGFAYLDGGVKEHIPIQKAIDLGCDEIDVIILRTEVDEIEEWQPKNILNVFMRTIELMESEISKDDVLIGQLKAKLKDVTINLYYTPYKLTDNSLIFNKEEMTKWWNDAYDYTYKTGVQKTIRLSIS